MELNAEQIIKDLECCYMQELEHNENCPECPYTDLYPNCAEYLGKDALSLIKELAEENERLENVLVEQSAENVMLCGELKHVKADTVRKMQKRIKTEKFHHKNFGDLVYIDAIDQIAKEILSEPNPGAESCVVCGDDIPEGRQVCIKCEGD